MTTPEPDSPYITLATGTEHLAVQVADGVQRHRLAMNDGDELTLGRSTANSLPINEPTLSATHAKLSFRNGQYRIEDLGSTNGTFKRDGQRILYEPHALDLDEEFRLGLVWFRVERTATHTNGANGTAAPKAHFSVTLDDLDGAINKVIVVDPKDAQPKQLTFTIHNESDRNDHFDTVVKGAGVNNKWFSHPPRMRVVAHDTETGAIGIKIDARPENKAKTYDAALTVTSVEDPGAVVSKNFRIEVQPFSSLQAELRPKEVRSRSRGTLVARNRGNSRVSLTAEWQGDNLEFEPLDARFDLEPGSEKVLTYLPRTQRREGFFPVFGNPKSYPFTAQISPESGPKMESIPGNFILTALMPMMALPIIIGGLIAGGGYVVKTNRDTAATKTATAVALASASASAAAAAAAWPQEDDDRDGTPNGYDTNPNATPMPTDTPPPPTETPPPPSPPPPTPTPSPTPIPTPTPVATITCPPDPLPIDPPEPGSPIDLKWKFTHVAKAVLEIDGDEQEVVLENTLRFYPLKSTTYVMKVTLRDGTVVTCRSNVFILPTPTPDPDIPVVIPGQGQLGRRLIPITMTPQPDE